MLYNENNLSVAKIASKNSLKAEITGVLFTKNKTVATDSFRLLEVSTPAGITPDMFPKVDGATAMRGCEPFIVAASAVKEIKIPPKGLGIIQNMAIKHVDENRVEFLTTDLETANVISMRRIMGTFPDYEPLFPKEKPAATISIDGQLLAELLQAMAKMAADGHNKIRLKVYGVDRPLVLEVSGAAQKGRGLLMPLKE